MSVPRVLPLALLGLLSFGMRARTWAAPPVPPAPVTLPATGAAQSPLTAPSPRPAAPRAAAPTAGKPPIRAPWARSTGAKPLVRPRRTPSRFRLLSFELGGAAVRQTGGSLIETSQFGWTPTYKISSVFALRAKFTGMPLRNASQSVFFAVDTALYVSCSFDPDSEIALEAGGGGQYWLSNGGFAPVAGGNLVWLLPERFLGVVDRVFGGYTHLFAVVPTDEFKVGLGFRL